MSYLEKTIASKDGYPLALRIYEADTPKAVVKCIHGMEEYQDRYMSFAEYLQEATGKATSACWRTKKRS